MRFLPHAVRATLLATLLALPAIPAHAHDGLAAPDPRLLQPNDNRRPAGRLQRGVLTVRLVARDGAWQPRGPEGLSLRVAGFAEDDGPLQTPGPLIRAESGTEVRVIVHNTLALPLYLFGLGAARGVRTDSVEIAPGATRTLHFTLGEPGTFYYWARTTYVKGAPPRTTDDSQLHGAIVIDPKGATARQRRDRIFVISEWFTQDTTTVSGLHRGSSLAINGREWPLTERLEATQGDTLRWRIVNTTILEHPMHLHGFYYSVDARGDGKRDTIYAPAQRRQVVTEVVLPGRTMALSWAPTTAGNWIFHCHFASHMTTIERMESDRRLPVRTVTIPDAPHATHGAVRAARLTRGGKPAAASHDDLMRGHMAGLVMGIRVKPRGPQPEYGAVARGLSLEIRSKASVYGEYAGYAYVMGGSAEAADANAMPIPGPTLVLNKGERVGITIVNRTHEPAAVHWHGIELESLPDGVPGWSGAGKQVLPLIEPGDSLTVRFTPPRAGTFMYHSHSNEMQQISSGLYGAIVVVDPKTPRDTARERLLLFSDDGPLVNFFNDAPPAILLNGHKAPPPLELRAGTTYRLRLINIRSEALLEVALLDGEQPAEWRMVAVDGAELPEAQRTTTPATLWFGSGQIRDVEFTPRTTGALTLRYKMLAVPASVAGERKTPVVVR